jgi:hypothetical protein
LRAANYLSVGQIYFYDNPLLRQSLTKDHIKPRLLGHWGVRRQNIWDNLRRDRKEDLAHLLSDVMRPGRDGEEAAGLDYVNLSTPITPNSGIWTLTTTVNMSVPDAQGQFATVQLGFGNFTNTQNVLNQAGNSITGPGIADGRQRPSSPAITSASYLTGAGMTPFPNAADPNESQTAPVSFKIVPQHRYA